MPMINARSNGIGPKEPTQEEMTRSAEQLTEVVLLLHAGDWEQAQKKMLGRILKGLPNISVHDTRANYESHMNDAMRYGRAMAKTHSMSASEIAARRAAQDEANTLHRYLMDQAMREASLQIPSPVFMENVADAPSVTKKEKTDGKT